MALKDIQTVTGSFSTLNEWTEFRRASASDPWVSWGSVYSSHTGQQKVKSVSTRDTPGFHKLLECGEFLPYNPFHVSTETTTRVPGSGSTVNDIGTLRYEGNIWIWHDPLLDVPPEDPAIATYVVNAAAADARSSIFDALTFAAELRKTNEMVRNRFLKVAGLTDSIATRAARTRDPFKTMSDLWLEYRYGWLPLVYSVQDGLNAFANKVMRGDIIKGTAAQEQDLTSSKQREIDIGPGTYYVNTVITGSRKYYGRYYARVTAPELFKFGSDPLRTGWELVPWSFVFDWFVDVNSYLQAVSPFQAGHLLGGGYSTKTVYTLEQTSSVIYEDPWTGSVDNIKTVVEVERYERTPMGVSLPSWNPRLTSVRVADLAALIYGRARNVYRILTR